MRIGGLQSFSVIDYPGKVAAILFTQGCHFRCPYCYNPELVIPKEFREIIPQRDVLEFLERRKKYLQGVVVTGGEPTIQNGLIPFLKKIKQLGYLIKLDTNGSQPDVLKQLIERKLVNFIAMDIKAPLKKYELTVKVKVNVKKIQESIDLILQAGLPYEFRTTVVKPLCSTEDLYEIICSIPQVKCYSIQKFIPSEKILDKTLLTQDHYCDEEISRFRAKWERRPCQNECSKCAKQTACLS